MLRQFPRLPNFSYLYQLVALLPALLAVGAGDASAAGAGGDFASARHGFSASFIGDAAAVGLAFILPALLAGAWLGTATLVRALGWRGMIVLGGIVGVTAVAAIAGWQGGSLLRLAGG